MLSAYGINSDYFIHKICGAANSTVPVAEPTSYPASANSTVLRSFQNATSSLFAYELGISSATSAQAASLCSSAPLYASRLAALRLNPAIVQSVLCSITEPLDNNHASAALWEWSSRVFVETVVGASDAVRWKQWLCGNLDEGRLKDVGLNGTVVLKRLCGGTAVGVQVQEHGEGCA
jgi:hypothetical protein